LRLFGGRDLAPGYNLLMSYGDLVLTGRGGAWAPPENSVHRASYVEWAVELALRFSIASDAINAQSQSVSSDPVPTEGK